MNGDEQEYADVSVAVSGVDAKIAELRTAVAVNDSESSSTWVALVSSRSAVTAALWRRASLEALDSTGVRMLSVILALVAGGSLGFIAGEIVGIRSVWPMLTGSLTFSVAGFLWLYGTDITELNRRITEQQSRQPLLEDRIIKLKQARGPLAAELTTLRTQRRHLVECLENIKQTFWYWQKSVSDANRPLLRTHWRELRGVPFEDWLAQLFKNLGGSVERTPASGDQGVDLLVRFGPTLIAVQAKGYPGSTVGNKAIQEVYYGKDFYNASLAVVMTNSTFTKKAIEGANRVRCLLVDAERMADLAQARIAGLRAQEPR